MTIYLRFEDFDAVGERINLGGRNVRTRDILSVAIHKRVSAALLGYALIGGLLILTSIKATSIVATITCLALAALLLIGAFHER